MAEPHNDPDRRDRDLGDAAQPEVITCYLCNGDGVRHIGDGLEFETFECTACGGSGLTESRLR